MRPSVEAKIREHLAAGNGIIKTARTLGVGTGTVHRIAKADRAAGVLALVDGPALARKANCG